MEIEMSKKGQILISLLLIVLFVFIIFKNVNYDLNEFKLSIKAITRQQLTLEEMKSSVIYEAYSQIDQNTKVEEINSLLNKKSKNVIGVFESWYYPYGYLSIWYRENEETRVFVKILSFKTPYITKLSENEFYSVFKCTALEEISDILGEPAILSKTYDKKDAVSDSSYEWGIKTILSKEVIDKLEEQYGEYVSFPNRYSSALNFLKSIGMEKKLRLRVSINTDNTIESFSIEEYKK
jgi:hypothetical protein